MTANSWVAIPDHGQSQSQLQLLLQPQSQLQLLVQLQLQLHLQLQPQLQSQLQSGSSQFLGQGKSVRQTGTVICCPSPEYTCNDSTSTLQARH